ncbi:hypothetical protein [Aquimarina pacifica]|uniref:hypothetical protein n=1 Tax=Aquimarina pacifica TaxID=1296415 RepID=UPI0004719412|nr:hypothetical protein [Aquimarina pacifica]
MKSLNCFVSKVLVITAVLISSFTMYSNEDTLALEAFSQTYQGAYDLTIPESVSSEKMSLYIILPGGVGNAKYPALKETFFTPALNDDNSIIFSPKISWRRPSIKKLEHIITDFIRVAKRTYPIDSDNIVLVGYSNGAQQGLELIESNDTLFSSYIAIASNIKLKRRLETPICIIQWDKDFYFPIQKMSRNVKEGRDIGCNLTLIIASNNDGMGASEYTDELKDFVSKL